MFYHRLTKLNERIQIYTSLFNGNTPIYQKYWERKKQQEKEAESKRILKEQQKKDEKMKKQMQKEKKMMAQQRRRTQNRRMLLLSSQSKSRRASDIDHFSFKSKQMSNLDQYTEYYSRKSNSKSIAANQSFQKHLFMKSPKGSHLQVPKGKNLVRRREQSQNTPNTMLNFKGC